MKDEELAEEYYYENYTVTSNIGEEERKKNVITNFLAGLKAGRPQLHDLRKDPNDLPKDNDKKLCFYEKGKVVAWYDKEYDCWETEFNNIATTFSSSILIGWCETPNFDEV